MMRTFILSAAFMTLSGACLAAPAASPDLTAPAVYRAELDLSCGPVVVEVTRADAPLGADRFYSLVKAHFFDGARFFRVVPGFVVQFGLAADPAVSKAWDRPIKDEPVRKSNAPGTLSFAATSQPNSRTTQLFINLGNNLNLDGAGFAPFGRVVSGMENVAKIYAGDAENPDQDQIFSQGNAYLQKAFPHLDCIESAKILP